LPKSFQKSKDEFYALSFCTGATKNDALIDIDGGIGTVFAFAGKGSRELPNAHVYIDGGVEGLSKGGTFVGQHVYVSREGAAVHINALIFRCGECWRSLRRRYSRACRPSSNPQRPPLT